VENALIRNGPSGTSETLPDDEMPLFGPNVFYAQVGGLRLAEGSSATPRHMSGVVTFSVPRRTLHERFPPISMFQAPRRCAGLFSTGWACPFGSPKKSARPTGQLTGRQAGLNRVRAEAFMSQDYRYADSRGVAQHHVRITAALRRASNTHGMLTGGGTRRFVRGPERTGQPDSREP
jgi:hypothetical protein